MQRIVKTKYELISDLNKINHLRSLRSLILNFGRYHIEDVEIPTAAGLAESGYRALVCSETTIDDTTWKIAFMFRIGREKKAIWHTVVCVDYVLIDPSSRVTFSKVSNCVRLLSQFVLKRLKASCVDLLVNLDSQLNPSVKKHIADALINEGLTMSADGRSCARRLRSIDEESGKDRAQLPLPRVSKSQVSGMRPLVQSTLKTIRTQSGERVKFVGRIRPGSRQHMAILSFVSKHPNWLDPPVTRRTSYMQSIFTDSPGDVRRWVSSLIEDAHFIVSVDKTGKISSFLAFVVGWSSPAIMSGDGGGWASPGEYVNPERTVFVPALVCKSRGHGIWSKAGFAQALQMWRVLMAVLAEPDNASRFDLVGVQTSEGDLHSHLLDAMGFSCKATFSNLPYYSRKTAYYSKSLMTRKKS